MSVITISRLMGAGGKTLGEAIAKTLSYDFIHNELIQMVAEEAKTSADVVTAIEQKAHGKLRSYLTSLVPKTFSERLSSGQAEFIGEEIYVDALKKILRHVASEGNVVILGRGSQFVLQNEPDTYHVLLTASMEYRIKFLETHYHLDSLEAQKTISYETKRRANLYRTFGFNRYDAPSNYHMVCNMDRLTPEQAVDEVCCLAQG